ncbi:MAG: DnaJ C-terminal domain-containing protein [Candidatus Dormibacteria bacterium]
MEFRDYYATLGVPRTAADKEIRSSYRKLARELHPDVNKDPKATERFKRVNEAYEVLKDPEKRSKYDRLGADWEQLERAQANRPRQPQAPFQSGGRQSGSRFGGFSDFFETFFSGHGGNTDDPLVEAELDRLRREQRAPRRGQDSEHQLDVTLREAAEGSARTVQLSMSESCSTCQGTGLVKEGGGGGATAVKTEVKTCPTCQGTGRQTRRRSLKVTIPKGVTEGSRIRVAGEGTAGPNGGSRGDLYLRVHLELEPGTEVRGRDVHTEIPVRDYRAALGGSVTTQGLTGGLEVTVPPGCPSGRTMRVPGKGIPALRAGGKDGDLFLKVRVTPSNRSPLTDAERAAYLELAKADSAGG